MKAVIKEKKGVDNVNYRDVPVPDICDDEVLIKVKAAGICGTDIHIFYDEYPYWPPVVLGHEFSGVIEKIGRDVKRFKVGDRVASEPQNGACGVCRYCRLGFLHLCSFKRSPGWGIDGAMAEYIKLQDRLLHKLPDNVSFIEGALIEPASTVTHAVIERGKIKPSDSVVIIGPGPIGLIAAQVASICGAGMVIVSGIGKDKEYRLKVAEELKVDFTICADEENLEDFVRAKTDGYGADMVVECSGSEKGINQSIDILAKNGKLVAMGLSGKEKLSINWDNLIYNEKNIISSISSSYTSWVHTINMLRSGKLNLKKIISNIMTLSEYREAFEMTMNKKGLKIILIPDGDFNNSDINDYGIK